LLAKQSGCFLSHHCEHEITNKMNYEESFGGTINLIKFEANKDNIEIQNAEIIQSLGISVSQFDVYLKEDQAPPEIFDQLRLTYAKYLKTFVVTKAKFDDELPDPLEDEK
jgi:hypothetical protein